MIPRPTDSFPMFILATHVSCNSSRFWICGLVRIIVNMNNWFCWKIITIIFGWKPHTGDKGITLLFHSTCLRCINFRVSSNLVRSSDSFISMAPVSVRPSCVLYFKQLCEKKLNFIKTNALSRSNNQICHNAHIWCKLFKLRLWNQRINGIEVWYVPLGIKFDFESIYKGTNFEVLIIILLKQSHHTYSYFQHYIKGELPVSIDNIKHNLWRLICRVEKGAHTYDM